MKRGLPAASFPLAIFAINLAISWRYFHAAYINQLASIEGVFVALERYIQHHWPAYDWFSLWYGGMPFTRVYQPGVHYAVALLSTLAGLQTISAYHATVAGAYSLGGVAFYFLARSLTGSRETAFFGALLFSVFSPSTLVSPIVRQDAGSIFHPRRLQSLILYGEGPNITGLTLATFALAAIHLAFTRKTPLATCIAGLAVAAVPIVSWPATIALSAGILAYLAALEWNRAGAILGRIAIVGILAFGFASPFAPPSTIAGTFAQSNVMDEAPTPGAPRWIAFALLLLTFVLARWLLIRSKQSFELRFAVLWALVTGWIVVAVSSFGIRMIPYPLRFHLAMEIPLVLGATLLGAMLPARRLLAVALVLFCAIQTRTSIRWLRGTISPIDITQTSEYQMAEWTTANLSGQRIFTRGTFAFWLNAFSDTPQVSGFFDQSISNPMDRHVSFLLSNGVVNDSTSADYSLLWLKAFAAGAIHLEGPQTADFYKDFHYPDRFRGILPVAWSRGDDYVYRVPERTPGLARVVPVRSIIRREILNASDVKGLRPFVDALDDPALPVARFHWQGSDSAQITGDLASDQAVAVAMNYDAGWTATVNSRPVNLHRDGIGLIAIEPHCSGSCVIDLHWSPRWEFPFALAAFGLALAASLAWCLL